MKKLGILAGSILLFLAIVLVGAPGILGRQVEAQLLDLTDQDFLSPYVELELIDFEKGWFSSKARLTARLGGGLEPLSMDAGGRPKPIRFDVELDHGPLIFGGGFRLGLARFASTAEIPIPEQVYLDGRETFNLKTVVLLGLGGDITLTVSSRPGEYELAERKAFDPDKIATRFNLDWKGFTARMTIDSSDGRVSISYDLPNGNIEIEEKNIVSTVRYGAMKAEGDYEIWRDYPAFGSGSFSWEGLELVIPDPNVQINFSLGRMATDGTTEKVGRNVAWLGGLEISGLSFKAKEFDKITVDSARLDLTLTGVSRAVYGQILEMQKSAQGAMTGSSRAFERQAERTIENLFKDGFEFKVPAFDLRMSPGVAHYDHVFKIEKGAVTDFDDRSTPRAFDYEANVWIDRELAIWMAELQIKTTNLFGRQRSADEIRQQAEQMIRQLISEGYFRLDGDRLFSKLKMKDGKFSVGRKMVNEM